MLYLSVISIEQILQLQQTSFILLREYDNLKGSFKSSNEMCEKLKRELISSNSKVHFCLCDYLSKILFVIIIAYCYYFSFLIYNLLLLLQLQKATTETNRTKEDMKALQNDLSNADKEITVRNDVLSTLLHVIYLLVLLSVEMLIFKGH